MSPAQHRRVARWVFGIIGFAVLIALVPLVMGLFVAWRAVDAVVPAVRTAVDNTPAAPVRRTTAALKDLPRGYHALDVAPPTGGYSALDAVGALPWAVAIAQAWEPDARITRIDVDRLRPDGTINVADDAEAVLRYRFVSARRAESLRQQARLRSDAEEAVGFWVQVKAGQPQVFADVTRASSLRDDELPGYPDSLGLPQLFARPAVRAQAADLPFLKGYLIALPREGWVWYFSSLANESRPRVRARDGAVWPYARGAN